MIGFAFCGSFCTLARAVSAMEALIKEGYDVLPIASESAYTSDTRFMTAKDFRARVESATGKKIIHTVKDAEPLGPKTPLDALVIAPCTGNTLAKLAHGITDTAVTMAAKAHWRCDRKLLIAPASNDAMSQNLPSIATLLQRKNVYFVPLVQDDPEKKPHSLIASFERIPEAMTALRENRQLRPLFLQ